MNYEPDPVAVDVRRLHFQKGKSADSASEQERKGYKRPPLPGPLLQRRRARNRAFPAARGQGLQSPDVDCYNGQRSLLLLLALALLATLTGCITDPKPFGTSRRCFDFRQDTFAYPNELVWEYYYNSNGVWTTRRHEPKPSYTLHCVVVARSARQFFDFARFDPTQPVAEETIYRRLVHHLIQIDPRRDPVIADQVIIPGYANLREFSKAHEQLLKEECGGAWQSYVQRGHWRMIFPFSRQQQQGVAHQLMKELQTCHPPIVHLVRFPSLSINHAILVYDGIESDTEIRFSAYDPNQPAEPVTLTFDRATNTFNLPVNAYFPGGRVDVYEIYHRWDY